MTDASNEVHKPSGTQPSPTDGAGGPHRAVDPARSARSGWWPAIAVGLVAFVDRLEMNLLAGALPAVQDHFGFGDAAAGAIPTATSIAGVLLLLPAGRLADRAPRVATIAVVVVFWSLCSLLSGLATSFLMFFVARMLIGAAGQLYNPPASSLLADHYPPRSRGRAYGFERAGYFLGLSVGVVLGGAIAQAHGWRMAFFIAAIPGLLVAAALILTVREPPRESGDDQAKSANGSHGLAPARAGSLAAARELLKIPALAGIIVGQALLALGITGVAYWLPTLLARTEDLDYDMASGLAGGAAGAGLIAGIVCSSIIGDRIHARHGSGRILVATVFLLCGAFALISAVLVPGVESRVASIAVACAGFGGALPNLTALTADVIPAERRGLGFALVTFLGSLGGAFGPFFVGVTSGLVEDTAGYSGEPLTLAMLALTPAIFLAIVVLLWIRSRYSRDILVARGPGEFGGVVGS